MIAPTPRETLMRDGAASLYRFRRRDSRPAEPGLPLLIVPSLINRWYVVDLREGASLVEALCEAGLDVWCLDWGVSGDEDRFLTWDEILLRLARAARLVRRETKAASVALLGYCMGATLASIHAALHPDETAALVNLAGPIDFSKGGLLTELVDPRHFDADSLVCAGNLPPQLMQAGFVALRPTANLAKLVGWLDRASDPGFREAFEALETWAADNVPFPAAAYATYIRELYQENRLVRGEHRVLGRRVDLSSIRCPVFTVVSERDAICPPPAALALNERCGSKDASIVAVPGGHVGAVVGGKARSVTYPALAKWLLPRLSLSLRTEGRAAAAP